MSYHIDCYRSFWALFDINLANVDQNSDLETLLEQENQTEAWRYLIGLIQQEDKWQQYISPIKGHSLYCVKTNSNKISKEVGVPHRLFFLVEHRRQRITVLVNKRVPANHHDCYHHYLTIQERLNYCQRLANTGQAEQWLQPLHPVAATTAATTTNTTTSTTTSQSPEQPNLDNDIEQILADLDAKTLSSRLIVRLLELLLLQPAHPALLSALMTLLQRDDVNLGLQFYKGQFELSIQLGLQGTVRSHVLATQPGANAKEDGVQLIESVLYLFDQNPIQNKQACSFLLNSLSFLPETILAALFKAPKDVLPTSREWVRHLVYSLEADLQRGLISPKETAQVLRILKRQQRLPLLPQTQIQTVLSMIMHVWAVEKVSQPQVTAAGSACASTATTTTQRLLNQLNDNDSAQAQSFYEECLTVVADLIPMMRINQLKLLLLDNLEVLDAAKLQFILSHLTTFSISERCSLLLMVIAHDRSLVQALPQRWLHDFTQEIRQADQEEQFLCAEAAASFILAEMDGHASDPLAALASTLAGIRAQLPKISNAPAARPSKKGKAKQKANKSPSNQAGASNPNSTELLAKQLRELANDIPRYSQDGHAFIARANRLLNPYIKHGQLQLPTAVIQPFIDDFIRKPRQALAQMSVFDVTVMLGKTRLFELLMRFCQEHDAELFQQILQEDDLLDTAAINCQPGVLQLLLNRYQCDPSKKNKKGIPALHRVIAELSRNRSLRSRAVACVNSLINAGADVSAADNQQKMPVLHFACWNELDLTMIKLLLDRGADPNEPMYYAFGEMITALDCLASRKVRDGLAEKCLIRYGARHGSGFVLIAYEHDPVYQSRQVQRIQHQNYGLTSHTNLPQYLQNRIRQMQDILLAYVKKKITKAHLLQAIDDNKLCVNISIGYGYTLLHYAIQFNDIALARELLANYQPNTKVVSENQEMCKFTGNLLHFAIMFHAEELWLPLIEQGCPTNTYNRLGFTPFHIAVQYGQVNAVRLLLAHGHNPNQPTSTHAPPNFRNLSLAQFCQATHNPEMFRFIFECQRDSQHQPSLEFLLRQAVIAGDLAKIDRLVAAGADINGRNADNLGGLTPLHLACFCRCRKSDYKTIAHLVKIPGILANITSKPIVKQGEVIMPAMTPLQFFAAAHNGGHPPRDDSRQRYFEVHAMVAELVAEDVMLHHPGKSILFDNDGSYRIINRADALQIAEQKRQEGDIVHQMS